MLGTLALLAMGAGTGLSAWSKFQQGEFASEMHDYNRSLSLRYSRAIREIRAYEETGFWKEAAKVYPRQKVKVAAAGIEVSGTPLKVMKETRRKLSEQAQIMRMEKKMEIAKIKQSAAISGMRGQMAEKSGRFGVFSTLLTGGGQIGLAKYKYGDL